MCSVICVTADDKQCFSLCQVLSFLSFSLLYFFLCLLLFFFLWFPLPNEKTFCAIVDWNALLRNVLLVTAQCYGTKGKERTECRSVIKYSFIDCIVIRKEGGFESRYTRNHVNLKIYRDMYV